MKLKVFKNGISVHDLKKLLYLQKSVCEEYGIPEEQYFTVDELSSEREKYIYHSTTSKNMIEKIFLLHKISGKYGLSIYSTKSDSVKDLTDCNYDIIEMICNDTFILKNIFGKSTLVVKEREVFKNINKITGYDIVNELFVVLILDDIFKFHVLIFSTDDSDFVEVCSVKEFNDKFNEILKILNARRLLDSCSVGELNEFRDEIDILMLNRGFDFQ